MYLIQLGGIVYEPKDGRAGWPLPEAMREVYGTAGAWILRPDGTVAVMMAGNAGEVMHLAHRRTGEATERVTKVRRRKVLRSLRCEMTDTCAEPVTHLDDSGWIYCTAHGEARRPWKNCRRLRPHELNRLRRGEQVARY